MMFTEWYHCRNDTRQELKSKKSMMENSLSEQPLHGGFRKFDECKEHTYRQWFNHSITAARPRYRPIA